MTHVAGLIDHTLLKADCTLANIKKLCEEAQEYQFAGVCIPPFYVAEAVNTLEKLGATALVSTVIGFPMGYASTVAKVEEIKRALDEGASEVDAVINLCAVKSQNWGFVHNDIDSMTTATRLRGKKIKIIIETGLLSPEELAQIAKILLETAPDFVKTSTGMLGEGPQPSLIEDLDRLLEQKISIKASGGIRDRATALALIAAGARRLGTSAGVAIVQEDN